MSWNFDFHAATIEAAKQRIEIEHNRNSHFPSAIARALVANLNAMPAVEDTIVYVKSAGSVGYGGNGAYPHGYTETSIKLLNVLPEAKAAEALPDVDPGVDDQAAAA